MTLPTRTSIPRVLHALAATVVLLFSACGGGAGGAEAGQGLVLLNFQQGGQDNVPINRILRFQFSEAVDPATIDVGSIQIRQGSAFGLTAAGEFRVDGAEVYFEPRLPSLCDASDSGLRPGTTYRVTLLGFPEENCVQNAHGQPLGETTTFEFATRPDGDPELLEDQVPGVAPSILYVTPGPSEAGVTVTSGNAVRIGFSENLDPCSVNDSTVRFRMYEIGIAGVTNAIPAGEPNAGNATGFTPWDDQDLDEPKTWGTSGVPLTPPQTIPATLTLTQDFDGTELRITPDFGRFPENALCVVDLTFGIEDLGGSSLTGLTTSFTTENLAEQSAFLQVDFDQSTEPWPLSGRTMDVDTVRSPGLAQAWMLFSGDGDNGSNLYTPCKPGLPGNCDDDRQPNDGIADDFDPDSNRTLHTGSTVNTCPNTVDGSTAVVWEFRSFRIRDGVTVNIVGVNPAIILVQGDALIEPTGVLQARGGNGQTGYAWTSNATAISQGGSGAAGGGDGGDAARFNTANYGEDGWSASGSADGYTLQGGEGAGQGGSIHLTVYPSSPGTSQGGGGGGHAEPGVSSTNVLGTGHTNKAGTRGAGGAAYPTAGGQAAVRMLTPSAGGGGGAGGNEEWTGSYAGVYSTGGGGGGAGGGFLDITASGDIQIFGTIDVSGGRGGSGGSSNYYAGPGGGGGGAGGGIRLITASDITLADSTLLTAAGGVGGTSPNGSSGTGGPQNHGGAGGNGRIVLEDQDSVIDGLQGATVVPGDGQEGFYRGAFDSARFRGGGLRCWATSGPILIGPLSYVSFVPPVAEDFLCVIPTSAGILPSGTGLVLEASGYPISRDGTVDLSGVERWYTIGYFAYSGTPAQPTWREGTNPPDAAVANDGIGIHNLDGSAYVRVRLTGYLPDTVGPQTPGPCLDWMRLHITYDQ